MTLKPKFYGPSPKGLSDPEILFEAEMVRWLIKDKYIGPHGKYPFGRMIYAEVDRDYGLPDGTTQLMMGRKREPSKRFLDAAGFEKVVLYRRKQT